MASSVDAKLLKATKFPPEFNQKVDMHKVNAEVMKKYVTSSRPGRALETNQCDWHRWIAGKIIEILGNEDDVVIELCFNLIEGARFVHTNLDFSCAKLMSVTARYQEDANTIDRIPRQGYSWFLQRTMEALFECANESARRPQGITRGQEAGTYPGEGTLYHLRL